MKHILFAINPIPISFHNAHHHPGSVGYSVYNDERPYPHAIETGSPDVSYAVLEKLGVRWCSDLIAVPYDHMPMVRLAHIRKRNDWESALLYGTLTDTDKVEDRTIS